MTEMASERMDWAEIARNLGKYSTPGADNEGHGQTKGRATAPDATEATNTQLEGRRSHLPKRENGQFRALSDDDLEARERGGGQDFPPPEQRGFPLEAKRRAVVLFAQFHRVRDVADKLAEEFGREFDLRSVARLNPEGPKPAVGKALIALFERSRDQYVRNVTNIGVASQAFRLRALERLAMKAEDAGQISLALQALEQSAKEVGGLLTNTKQVKHEARVEHRHLSLDDQRAELAMRLTQVIDGGIIVGNQGDKADDQA